jgi:hypothetical protein
MYDIVMLLLEFSLFSIRGIYWDFFDTLFQSHVFKHEFFLLSVPCSI